ncbi:MAG: hypothetical protein ACK4XK_02555 [Casimicrobiaceae bacterium]
MNPRPIVLLDSVSAVSVETEGAIVITGSHAGISAARLALAHPPGVVVFNDAGVGLERAGVAGLALLEAQGVAACAVAHDSARIGEAASTLATGVISESNRLAISLGAVPGRTVAAWLRSLPEATHTTRADDDHS